jgi:MFS family permease
LVPLLPLFLDSLGSSPSRIGFILGLGSLSALAHRLFSGWLIDRWGRVTFLMAAAAVSAVGAALLPFAHTDLAVIPFRIVLAGAMAIYITAATAFAADLAPDRRRGEALAWFGSVAPLAMALGPLLSGHLLKVSGYHAGFYGSALFATLATLVALAMFRLPQARRATPGRGLQLLSRPAFIPSMVMLPLIASNGALFAFVPMRAETMGLSNIGSFFAVYALCMMLVRVLSGKWSDQWGRAAVILPGCVAAAGGLVLLALAQHPWSLLLAGALYGASLGAAAPGLTAWTVDRVSSADRGTAVSTFLMAQDVGIALGSMATGLLIAQHGFTLAFLVLSVGAAAGTVLFVAAWTREHGYLVARPQ